MAQFVRPFDRAPETQPMGPAPTYPPNRIILWKVRLKIKSDDEVDIDYVKCAEDKLDTGENIDKYLKRLSRNVGAIAWKDPDYTNPGKTSLSIAHNGYSYMVFVLTKHNWQFSEEMDPFRIEDGKEGYYLDPKCVWKQGRESYVARQPPKGASSTIACFVANAEEDYNNSPTKPRFNSRFNIYVDFILDSTGGGPRLLPITIDPDVGYPEGTKP